MELEEARLWWLGWTQQRAAAWAGVTVRTWRRWEAGEGTPPRVLRWALRAAAGDLGALSAAWSGWRLDADDGLLYEPDAPRRHGWAPGEVAAIYWRRLEVAALEREARELGACLQRVVEQRAANVAHVPVQALEVGAQPAQAHVHHGGDEAAGDAAGDGRLQELERPAIHCCPPGGGGTRA